MSLEIKSVNVENEEEENVITIFQSFGWKLKSSQRIFNQTSSPRGAISYENLTYIHSETETVDFTKLVFERDTNMPNYDEIVELEEEFWELSSECPSDRPPAPDLMDFKEWVKKTKPIAFPKAKKIKLSILFYCAFPILMTIGFILSVSTGGYDSTDIIMAILLPFPLTCLFIPPNLVISKFGVYLCNSKILKQNFNNMNPTYYEELQSQYSQYVDTTKSLQEAAISYDNTVTAMRRLLCKSQNLL